MACCSSCPAPEPGELLTLADVARRLPPGPSGRKPSTCAIWRWCVKGVDGIKLPAIRLGSTWYVKPSALESFGAALAAKSIEKLDKPTCAPPAHRGRPRSEARRARDIEAAKEILRREGCLK